MMQNNLNIFKNSEKILKSIQVTVGKTGGRKSCETFPLNLDSCNSYNTCRVGSIQLRTLWGYQLWSSLYCLAVRLQLLFVFT